MGELLASDRRGVLCAATCPARYLRHTVVPEVGRLGGRMSLEVIVGRLVEDGRDDDYVSHPNDLSIGSWATGGGEVSSVSWVWHASCASKRLPRI
jgi:hypothetical protein